MSKIVLKAGKERSLYRLHPWVFSGAIAKIKGTYRKVTSFKCITVTTNILPRATTRSEYRRACTHVQGRRKLTITSGLERIRQAYLTRVAIGFGDQPRTTTCTDSFMGKVTIFLDLSLTIMRVLPSCNSIPWECIKVREEITKAPVEVMGINSLPYTTSRKEPLPFKAGLNPQE